jgi:tetratricopeptide (TPR) repeat protein
MFLRVIEIDPSFAAAYQNLGAIAFADGDTADAQEYFYKAAELNPEVLGAIPQELTTTVPPSAPDTTTTGAESGEGNPTSDGTTDANSTDETPADLTTTSTGS